MSPFFFKIVISFFIVLLLCIVSLGGAQITGWNTSPFSQKVFIENNSQLDGQINVRTKILFGASQPGVDMYWSAKGLTYKVTEYYLSERAKREMRKEDNPEEWKEHVSARYHYLNMEWMNSNPSAEVIGEKPVSNYFTYANQNDRSGKSGIKALAYKKITYKNIYPGIDMQYILPEDKEGIKYSFVIHPGADPGMIKIHYNGANKTSINSNGEVEIHSVECGDYLEHQPETYYQNGTRVKSEFFMQNEIISFNIHEYDKSKILIIDPWVSIVNFPPGTNTSTIGFNTSGYDVGYDNAGNVWVYGGADPVYLAKYNSVGTLLWTYSVPFSAWDLVGDFDVNKISGTAYICAGSDCTPTSPNGLPAGIVKINSQGIQTGKFTGNNKNYEISRIRLDCSGNLYMTGGGVQAAVWQVAGIDTNLTTVTGAHITSSPNGDHDECLMTIDPTGNFMYMNFNHAAVNSADFLNDNEMQKVPLPAYSPAVWINPGPTHHFVEMQSLTYAGIADGGTIQNGPARINMFNGMVCGNGFLYTYNGDTLKQWNKNTGVMIKQVITGGTRYLSGGLDLDLCENVYAGVSNKVLEYDANLNIINTYSLPNTTCYDIKVDKNNNLLYACGKDYVCSIALGQGTIKTFSTSVTPASCNACNGTAAATFSVSTTTCGVAFNYSYKWFPGGETTSSITGLCAGTYTVIAEASLNCLNTFLDTGIVVVTGSSGIVANYSTSPVCFNNPTIFTNSSTGTSATTQWLWDFGDGTTSTIKDPTHTYGTPGSFTVTLVAKDSNGCNDTIQHPIFVNPLPVANFSSLPVCLGNQTCFTDGSVVTPGTIMGWSWNFGDSGSGAANTSSLQNPCHTYGGSGTFTVILTVTSDSGCQNTIILPAYVNPIPTAVIIPKNGCLNSMTTFTDGSTSASGLGNKINSWLWNFGDGTSNSTQQNPSHIYTIAGTYTVTLIVTTVSGCKDTAISAVVIYNPPVSNFSKPVQGCSPVTANYTDLSTSADGTVNSWQWSFPGGSPLTSTVQNPTGIQYITPGTYSVSLIITTNYGCMDTIKLPMVEVYPWPNAEFCIAPRTAPTTNPVFNFCDMWSNDVVQWTWDFGDNSLTDSINTDPVHSYSATANNNDFYKYDICIHVINQYGCWDTTCHTVELIPEFVFYIPNTFTPNGDGTNEMFYGKCRGVKEYNIWLFDRWGNQVWDCHHEDKNTNWDSDITIPRQEGLASYCKWNGVVSHGGMDMGGNSGQLAQEDVYVWKVNLLDIFNKQHTYIGHVNIVR